MRLVTINNTHRLSVNLAVAVSVALALQHAQSISPGWPAPFVLTDGGGGDNGGDSGSDGGGGGGSDTGGGATGSEGGLC